MKEIKESKTEEWDEEEADDVSEDFVEGGNVMQFSDFVDNNEKQFQKLRITELRRRAEERQDWKRITGEIELDLDFDDARDEEA